MRKETLDNIIPSDFILVRFQLLDDFYEMNDNFNQYLDRSLKGSFDERGFFLWLRAIRSFYLQIRSSLKKNVEKKPDSLYKNVILIMEEVLIKNRRLTKNEAKEVTLLLGDYAYDIKLTDISHELEDLGKIFSKLN